ncbi:hypothetical protein [Brevibacillus centrosporus]|jgi:hypothetical protein|uniref:hypothetical protein n=1 Tax=Brevibacillus centrosporus TaxID=54910 RepID=UPI002E23EF67|nr:hypothetical protein [Brevibacillus centrosporus]
MGMKPPVTYAEWLACLDAFVEGTRDEELLLQMQNGSIEWTRGIAERMTQRLFETIETRLKQTSELLDRELKRSNGDETALVKSLLTARRRLAVIKKLTELPAFPQQVRDSLFSILQTYAKDTQKSLEDSAKADRTGQLRMLIKNNSLTVFHQMELPVVRAEMPEQKAIEWELTKPAKRRVILK